MLAHQMAELTTSELAQDRATCFVACENSGDLYHIFVHVYMLHASQCCSKEPDFVPYSTRIREFFERWPGGLKVG